MDIEQRRSRDARSLAGDPRALALIECFVEHLLDPALDTPVRERRLGRSGPLEALTSAVPQVAAPAPGA